MAFGFPAYSTDSRKFNASQEQIASAVRAAFERLGWRYQEALAYVFTGEVSVNLSSWGEKVRVEISYDGVVTVRSECAMPWQCIDWGKNGDNVRKFFHQLTSQIPAL